MNIAILILNWNGKSLSVFPTIELNIALTWHYVVDNASSDNSIDYIKNNHPKVKTIEFNENYGYTSP